MPRERRTISVDGELLRVFDSLRERHGKSFSVCVEEMLASQARARGLLPLNYQVPGETRGGDRSKPKTEEA